MPTRAARSSAAEPAACAREAGDGVRRRRHAAADHVRLQRVHGASRLAAPVAVDGLLCGCVFARAAPGDDGLLAELVELAADRDGHLRRRQRSGATGAARRSARLRDALSVRGHRRQLARRCRRCIACSRRSSSRDSTVLVNGENGTGKELIARAIHYNGPRAKKPFVVQNCSRVQRQPARERAVRPQARARSPAPSTTRRACSRSPTAAPSSSTRSATCRRRCRSSCCACCRRGPSRPSAAPQPRKVDVRIIAATHKDLQKMVERGEFREDLYYRINVIKLTRAAAARAPRRHPAARRALPAKRHAQAGGGAAATRLSPSVPGAHARVRLAGQHPRAGERDRAAAGARRRRRADRRGAAVAAHPRRRRARTAARRREPRPAAVDALERKLIYEVLKRTHWNKTKAAEELRISRRNLIRKVNKYKLDQRRLR